MGRVGGITHMLNHDEVGVPDGLSGGRAGGTDELGIIGERVIGEEEDNFLMLMIFLAQSQNK